jgi:protein involved in polysaccharide export with SLBB domain
MNGESGQEESQVPLRDSRMENGSPRQQDSTLMQDSDIVDRRPQKDEKADTGEDTEDSTQTGRGNSQTQRNTSPRQPETTPTEPQILRSPAPYNLQSLRDLYTQLPQPSMKLRRFGSDVFLVRTTASRQMPLDLPIGPDYVLGAGDGLTINLWGGVSQTFSRVVDREGKIALPEAGSIVVAGLTLEDAETLIRHDLSEQFHDAQVAVTIAHLRTVRIYVVGDVQRPGAYDISSLSTPLNALYAAGGPTAAGSLRTVRHMRGKELVRQVDLYDFLLHGVRTEVERLQDGDTILVPSAGPQVVVAGMVKRPAIYELNGPATLADLLDDAGGVQIAAALSHITIDRIGADEHRITISFNPPDGGDAAAIAKAMQTFAIQDGDRIMVAPILPYSEKAIYIEGHVARPGRYSWHDGLSLSDVIRSYQDMLPEPADHGEIIRLDPPDLRPETIEFSVPELLAGNVQIHLQPFDTIRILGRYEAADAPRVTIRGEVLRPGIYALSQQMTAAQLVRMAGGFKRSALLENADLASYDIRDGRQVVTNRTTIQIGRAVNAGDATADVTLKPGDVLTVHQVSGWNDIGASIKLSGEINYPGSYGLQEGERLSSALRRAGGFRASAYPAGAVLLRLQVKDLEEKSREELIHQIETTSTAARLAPSASGDQTGTLQLLAKQQEEVLQRLRSQPVSGRLVININSDIDRWANTSADIELRAGDILIVPKRPSFVLVNGQVYNTSAITFVPGKTAGWYLQRAGGATDLANRKEIFIVRANGQVVGRRSGTWLEGDVLSQRLDPGDIVVVPQKIISGSAVWRNLLSTAQILSTVAVVVAVSGGL